MASDTQKALFFLLLSVLIHLSTVPVLSFLLPREPARNEKKMRIQYVLRTPNPVSGLLPAPLPSQKVVMPLVPSSLKEPRRPHQFDQPQPQPSPTPVPMVSQTAKIELAEPPALRQPSVVPERTYITRHHLPPFPKSVVKPVEQAELPEPRRAITQQPKATLVQQQVVSKLPQPLPLPKSKVAQPRKPRQPSISPKAPVSHLQAPTALPTFSTLAARTAKTQTGSLPAPRKPSSHLPQGTGSHRSRSSAESEDPIRTYLAQVWAAIESQKRFPPFAQRARINGRVVLEFVILADGRVINPRIAESNGHRVFERAALDSLRRASPLPPFPPAIEQDRLVVQVPISYELSRR